MGYPYATWCDIDPNRSGAGSNGKKKAFKVSRIANLGIASSLLQSVSMEFPCPQVFMKLVVFTSGCSP